MADVTQSSEADGSMPNASPLKVAGSIHESSGSNAVETRSVEILLPEDSTPVVTMTAAKTPSPRPRENRWKLAFRQLMFMKRMNMQFNDRTKNEIEIRQQNITPLSLVCSVPYFNTFSAGELKELVAASYRKEMRPGDSRVLVRCASNTSGAPAQFFIVISGALALVSQDMDQARAVQQAAVSPHMKLAIGDYFAVHSKASSMKVIALEPVEFLVIPMDVIGELNQECRALIENETNEVTHGIAEMESYKRWALQFTRLHGARCGAPTAQPHGLAQISVAAFCQDQLSHITPENELDHTLELVQTIFKTVFGARKVRIYVIDNANHQLLVKFSDENLSKGYMDIANHVVASSVLLEGKAVSFADTNELWCSQERSPEDSALTRQLYQTGDMVLAAPFIQCDPYGGDADPPVVGILEVTVGSRSPAVIPTDNDTCIVKLAAKALSRYLYFHYESFFSVTEPPPTAAAPERSGSVMVRQISHVETLPAPEPEATAQDSRKLTIKINRFCAEDLASSIASAIVSVRMGATIMCAQTLSIARPMSPRPASKQQAQPQTLVVNWFSDMEILLQSIPHGSHIMITFLSKASEAVAWTGAHLFDFGHSLRLGDLVLDVHSYPESTNVITALEIENCLKRERATRGHVVGTLELTVGASGASDQGFEFSSAVRKTSIAFRASIFSSPDPCAKLVAPSIDSFTAEKRQLLACVKTDPLVKLTDQDRTFIWSSRHSLVEDPELLPATLLSVNWSDRAEVMEAYRLLHIWRQPTYLQALQLLSSHFTDPKVRAYAVRCLWLLPDSRLRLYMLQLVQALKNERFHDSALARFLLMRALQNPSQIGYLLYWFLRAEAHVHHTSERFELMMGQYLQLCGSYKLEIRQSVYVMKKLEEIATVVKHELTPADRREKLQMELAHVVLPTTFQLPLHPRTFWSGIIVDNCRVMDSKKRPLLLQLENAKQNYGRPRVIFKSGDDLRQDQLVLQLLRVMDDLWREAGLDLCLTPYACVSTGNELGLIEVVDESDTLASIIYARHKGSLTKLGRKLHSAKDALVSHGVLSEWLFTPASSASEAALQENPLVEMDDANASETASTGSAPPSPMRSPSITTANAAPTGGCFPLSPSKFLRRKTSKDVFLSRDEEITRNFVLSCAGYCVATYVLGVGDRHNDNIMLQRSGKFFHIDFGHFLGNFKSKLGVKRERAPFVFTPTMLDAIGGKDSENFKKFQTLACDAFKVLRQHANLLITLLTLALSCGIPELTGESDIKWVHRTLMLHLTDTEAEKRFQKLIHVALHTRATQLNDAVHLMAH